MSVKKGKRKLKPVDNVSAYGDRCRYWEYQRMDTIKEVYDMLCSKRDYKTTTVADRFAIALVSAALLGERLGETIVIRAVNNEFSIM